MGTRPDHGIFDFTITAYATVRILSVSESGEVVMEFAGSKHTLRAGEYFTACIEADVPGSVQ